MFPSRPEVGFEHFEPGLWRPARLVAGALPSPRRNGAIARRSHTEARVGVEALLEAGWRGPRECGAVRASACGRNHFILPSWLLTPLIGGFMSLPLVKEVQSAQL